MAKKTPVDQSKRRRANNEVIFKRLNLKTGQLVSTVFDEKDKTDVPVEFYCECSSIDCTEKISLTFAQFKAIRRRPDYFLVKPGHNQSDIETVVETNPGFSVVQKTEPLPAQP